MSNQPKERNNQDLGNRSVDRQVTLQNYKEFRREKEIKYKRYIDPEKEKQNTRIISININGLWLE